MGTIASTNGGASDGTKIISLAEYRRRFATPDDDFEPPHPGAAAARPVADLIRMEAGPSAALGNFVKVSITGGYMRVGARP